MRRTTINFWLNILSFVAMLGLVLTGLIIHWVLPAGTGGRGRGLALAVLGLGRHDWGDVHFWLAVATTVLLVAHLWLHWSWVTGMTTRLLRLRRPSTRVATLAGVGFLVGTVALVAGGYFLARENVRLGTARPHDRPAWSASHSHRSWSDPGTTDRVGHGTDRVGHGTDASAWRGGPETARRRWRGRRAD